MALTKRQIFEKYAESVIGLDIVTAAGDPAVGSAFHVGQGIFVTAGHNLDGIARPMGYEDPWHKERLWPPIKGHLHREPKIDVGVFKLTGEVFSSRPWVPLGSALDDWINDEAFITNTALVIGYPPIPLSKHPVLVSISAEVVAIADLYIGPHPRFILSSTARGGLSGSPAISAWDFALGMVTESLVKNDGSPESGYMAALSVEPLYECLAQNGLLPLCQKNMWDDFWDSQFPGASDGL